MSAADLATSIRAALVANTAITAQLSAYNSSYPIFTRRPVPVDAPYPMILVSPDVSITDNDGINDFRPVQTRDITVYGQNDTAAKYRTIEALAYAIREMFHGIRTSISVSGWHVIDINTTGPIPAPTDDEQTTARLVTLVVQLAKKA